MSRSNGRPEPEVIVNFGDGFSYSKGKMEEAFRSGLFDKQQPVLKNSKTLNAKKEDVDFIVLELEIPRAHAEKALNEQSGDLTKALQLLIAP